MVIAFKSLMCEPQHPFAILDAAMDQEMRLQTPSKTLRISHFVTGHLLVMLQELQRNSYALKDGTFAHKQGLFFKF